MAAKSRHSSGPVLDVDIVFPSMEKFLHKTRLSSIKSVIGVLGHLTNSKVKHEVAVREVTKLVYSKWYHDTVYCINMRAMERKLSELWKDFREGRRRVAEGRGDSSKVVVKYKHLVEVSDGLWDVFANVLKR